MSHWITDVADRIKAQTLAQDALHQRARHRHSLVEQRWTQVWSTVIAALSRDVVDFNRQFPDDPGQHLTLDHQITGLIISRDGSPFRQLRVRATAAGVQMHLLETDLGTMQRVSRDISPFLFTETPDGVGVEEHGHLVTPDAVSEHMLSHLL
jgi:hypothetical protein